MERLKKSFKAGTPLIPALEPYCQSPNPAQDYHFSIKEGSPDCFGHPKIFSHVLLERILEELGLNTFFSSYKGFSKLQYNVYGFAKLLLFGRLLNPASKSATIRQNEDYYEPVLGPHNPDNVFDTLDFLFANKDKIIRRINTNLVKKARRSPEIIYYDVTNFYFEIGAPDEDVLDEEGNVIEKGLRKMGVCKEERKLPIVQMGLFMDDEGIPVAIETFPGNTLDHLTLRKFLDFLKKLEDHPENFRSTAVQSKSLRKFFKKECVNERTGEILDSSKIRAFVDFDKVAEYKKSLGYYQIVTSELTMDAQEVIEKYHGLTQIENQFRVMKSDLETRPLYVSTPEHVTAHLLICMIALILMRIIQKRIRDSGSAAIDPDAYWSSGLNAGRIQAALNKWKVDLLPGDLYRFMDADDPDLKLILDAFGIRLPPKLYRRAELKHIKTEIKVFM